MQINIEKRHIFIILALMIFLAGVILVVAYGTNNPSIMGHSSQEVEVSVNGQTKTLQQAIDDKSLGGRITFVKNSFNTAQDTGNLWTSCARHINENIPQGYTTCVLERAEYPGGANCECYRICFA